MNDNLLEFYKEYCFSGIYSSKVPHSFGVGGKIAGALYAVGEIEDAIPIIHGPAGCGFHYRHNARRRYLPVYKAQCTGLEEKDIIFGGAEKLRRTVLDIVERDHPALIVIIPTTATDMIHDEMNSVVKELRPQISSRLIAIESEVFSHVDKNTKSNNFEQWVKNWNKFDQKQEHIEEFKGCGFGEAMGALVEQVMEKQVVIKRSINIEGFAWGIGGDVMLDGMTDLLKEIGIQVHSRLPNCTTKTIVEAPKAELNLIRRVRWAKKMKSIFGTDYLHVASPNSYHGLDGIERFHLNLAKRFSLQKEASEVLSRHKDDTFRKLQPVQDFLGRYRFALCSRSFGNIPLLVEMYEKDYGLPLSYVCVDMDEQRLAFEGKMSTNTRNLVIQNMYDALSRIGSKAQLLINPTEVELKEILREVDYVLDGKELMSRVEGVQAVPDMHLFTSLDFDTFRKIAINLAEKIKKTSSRSDLLINKFNYSSLSYPMLEKQDITSSHTLWRKMWALRGVGS